MKIDSFSVVFQEVPGHVSLAFSVKGCRIQCEGCHSPQLWNSTKTSYTLLTESRLKELIREYEGMITCVLFMGGEWYPELLVKFLSIGQEAGLKTCLYTGLDEVEPELLKHLDFLKTGKFIPSLGGLDSPTTNQKFIDLKTGGILNNLFF